MSNLMMGTKHDLIEENETGVYDEVGEISIETENQDMIHSHMNLNETETNRDNFDVVIDELPDDTYPAMIEDYVNDELDDMNQNDLSDKNKIGLDGEEVEKATDNVNEYVIHTNMNENDTETNQDTLEEVI